MDLPQDRSYSEQTAREIDQEVKRIVDESLEKVRDTLSERSASLEAVAQQLIEKETIGATELKEIVESTSSAPMIVPGTSNGPPRTTPTEPGGAGDRSQAESS